MQYLNRYVSITFEEHKMILIPIVEFFRENYQLRTLVLHVFLCNQLN